MSAEQTGLNGAHDDWVGRLRQVRAQQGITTTEQARQLGVCRQTIIRWEHHDMPCHPSTKRLVEGYLAGVETRTAQGNTHVAGSPLARVLVAVSALCRARQEERLAELRATLRNLQRAEESA